MAALLRIADSLRSSSAAIVATVQPALASSRKRRTVSLDHVRFRAGTNVLRGACRGEGNELRRHRLQFIVGIAKSVPIRAPVGQRDVTVLSRV